RRSSRTAPDGSFATKCGAVPIPSACPRDTSFSPARAASNMANLMLEEPAFSVRTASGMAYALAEGERAGDGEKQGRRHYEHAQFEKGPGTHALALAPK